MGDVLHIRDARDILNRPKAGPSFVVDQSIQPPDAGVRIVSVEWVDSQGKPQLAMMAVSLLELRRSMVGEWEALCSLMDRFARCHVGRLYAPQGRELLATGEAADAVMDGWREMIARLAKR